MRRFILLGLVAFMFISCAKRERTNFGAKDENSANRIEQINHIISMYDNKDYKQIERSILNNLSKYSNDNYAKIRLYNELANLYSYHILDIEKAIKIDDKIKKSKDGSQNSPYKLKSKIANNKILTSNWYNDNYIDISYQDIQKLSQKRIDKNKKLLKAKITSKKLYSKEKLKRALKISKENYKKTYPKTYDRYKAISKIFKREYELYRTTKDIKYIQSYTFLKKELNIYDVFLDEIDFISFSKYLQLSYKKTADKFYAQQALYVIYKPYINLRDELNRLKYNSIVNNYINILIDANYEAKDYKDMIYYISLNKSRMILEDILRNADSENNISTNQNLQIDQLTKLPKKEFIYKTISSVDNYLDFYIQGEYEVKKVSHLNMSKLPDGKRALLFKKKINVIQSFNGKKIYTTYIQNGNIKVIRISNRDSENIKKELESKYHKLVNFIDISVLPAKNTITKLVPFKLKDKNLVISTDKYLSKYPMDLFLDKNSIKTLNMFTYSKSDKKLDDIEIVGYFNPTKDLKNSEEEIVSIKKYFTGLEAFKKDEADINTLKKDKSRNILHLSMHGVNDSINPQNSMLLFAGTNPNNGDIDINKALLAKDMKHYSQLKNNELIFTAACETGLTKGTNANQSEIEGILRPLLINNNKNIILTLWKVNDRSAKDFVDLFYKNLAKTKKVKKAFLLAKDEIKKIYKSPLDWAPYYLIESK